MIQAALTTAPRIFDNFDRGILIIVYLHLVNAISTW